MAQRWEEVIRLVLETAGVQDVDRIVAAMGDLGDVSDETRTKLESALQSLTDAEGAQKAAAALGELIERQAELADAADRAGLRLKLLSEAEAAAADEMRRTADAVERAQAHLAEYSQQADKTAEVEATLRQALAERVAEQKEAETTQKNAAAALKAATKDYEIAAGAQERITRQIAPLAEAIEAAGGSTEDLAATQRKLAEQSDTARKTLEEFVEGAKRAADAQGDLAEAADDSEDRIRRMVDASLAARDAAYEQAAAASQSADALEDAAAAQEQLADSTDHAAAAQEQLADSTDHAADAAERAASGHDALRQSATAGIRDLTDYQAVLERGAASLEEIADQEERLDRLLQAGLITIEEQQAALARLTDDEKRLADQTREVVEQQDSLADSLRKTQTAMVAAGAAIYGVIRALSGAAGASSQFASAMARISSLSNAGEMGELRGELEKLTREFGGPAVTQADAYYELLRSGSRSAAEALGILAQANRLAIATGSDLQQTASALADTLDAFGLSAAQVSRVSDALNTTATITGDSIEQMSRAFGSVAGMASEAGLSVEELAAAIAALSTDGTTASQSAERLRGMLAAIVNPTQKAREAAAELGIQLGRGAIEAEGFAVWLDRVREAGVNNEAALSNLFRGVTGLEGALRLTGAQAATFARALEDMAGSTASAFEAASNLPAQSARRFVAAVDGLKRVMGDVIVAMAPMLDMLASLASGFSQLPEPIRVVAGAAAVLVAGLVPLVAAFRTLAPLLSGLVSALKASGAALAATATTAAGLSAALARLRAIAGPAIVALGVGWLVSEWKEMGDIIRNNAEQMAFAERSAESLAQDIARIKTDYQHLADIQRISTDELERMAGPVMRDYAEQLDGAARYWRAIEIEARRAGDAQRAALARERADGFARALDDVRARIKALGDSSGDLMTLQAAFEHLGVSAELAGVGITDTGRKAAEAFRVIATDATTSARQMSAAFTGALQQMATTADIQLLADALMQAFLDGKISAEEFEDSVRQAVQRLRELQEQLDRMGDSPGPPDAAEGLRDVARAGGQIAESFGAAEEAVQQVGDQVEAASGSARGFAAALASWSLSLRDMVAEFGDQALREYETALRRLGDMDGTIHTLGMSLEQAMDRIARPAYGIVEAWSKPAVVLSDLDRQLGIVVRGVNTLDDQTLDGLTASMSEARAEASALREEVDRALADLERLNREKERERLRREGDDEAIAALDLEDELAKIAELEKAAGAAGARAAEEARQRTHAEHQARLAELAERREAEKEMEAARAAAEREAAAARKRERDAARAEEQAAATAPPTGAGLAAPIRIELDVTNSQQQGERMQLTDQQIREITQRIIDMIRRDGIGAM